MIVSRETKLSGTIEVPSMEISNCSSISPIKTTMSMESRRPSVMKLLEAEKSDSGLASISIERILSFKIHLCLIFDSQNAILHKDKAETMNSLREESTRPLTFTEYVQTKPANDLRPPKNLWSECHDIYWNWVAPKTCTDHRK
jgi:hypothetical protein